MHSKAATVEEYLAELPADRRRVISAVRDVILENLDKGYEEGMQYGMIGYYVPHRVYPAGYHCNPQQPLPFACLASQKNYISLYLMTLYAEGNHLKWFEKAWKNTGRKLNMGKCCVRFRQLNDVALDVVGEAIRRVPAAKYIAVYEAAVAPRRRRSSDGRGKAKTRTGATAALKRVKRATGKSQRTARR